MYNLPVRLAMNTTRLAHEHWACQVTHIVFAFDSFHVFTHTTGLFWHFFVHARGQGYAWTAFTQTWIEMPCTLGYYLLHNSFSSPQRSQPLLGAHFCSHYWYTKNGLPMGMRLSATELRQLDNHQPSQSFICTTQVGLKCLSYKPGNFSVCAVRTPYGKLSPSGENPCWVVSHCKCSEHLASRLK